MSDFFCKNKQHITFIFLIIFTFLFLKFIFPVVIPFALAVLLVVPIHKTLHKIHKKTRIGVGFLTGGLLLVIFSLLGSLLWLACTYCIHKVSELIKNIDNIQDQFHCFVTTCSQMIEDKISIQAIEIENIILERVDIFIEDLQVQILPSMMNQSILYIKVFIACITFVVVMIIAAILIAKDFDAMKEKCRGMKGYREIAQICSQVGKMISSFFKAQILILAVVGIICAIGLYFAGNKSFLSLGVITGVLDVLPFVGTGVVLLPYMLWQISKGNIISAVILLITFFVSALARELLEPKLIGEKLGVLPILILFAVYAGVQIFGILGVILGPLYILLINEFYEKIYHADNDFSFNS